MNYKPHKKEGTIFCFVLHLPKPHGVSNMLLQRWHVTGGCSQSLGAW